MDLAAGVDFGGSSAKVGLVDREGTIRARQTVTIEAGAPFEEILAPVVKAIEAMRAGGKLVAVGVGTPGFTDSDGVLVGGCENIPCLRGRAVGRFLGEALGVAGFADNDATVAAAGELLFGAGRGLRHFVLATVGTAIGGGLVLDGRVYRGARGFAAEVGHVCVDPAGLWCNCGSRGCLEQYASGSAISRVYAEKTAKRGERRALSPREVAERASAGDPLALDTFDEAGRWLAQGLGTILNVLNLQACIVGGGVSQAGEVLLGPLRRHLPDFCWPQVGEGVRVLAAGLRNEAGIAGAAAQAFERLER